MSKAICAVVIKTSRGGVDDKQINMSEPVVNRIEAEERRLRALADECEAKMAEIANLVAHVRHEINNPLTGVLGQAQLLLREELSPTARRRVETIEQLASRIRDTVAQLRDVQRPRQSNKQAAEQGTEEEPPRH